MKSPHSPANLGENGGGQGAKKIAPTEAMEEVELWSNINFKRKGFPSHALSKSIRNAFFWPAQQFALYIFIYLFEVNLLSDSHGFTPPETEVTPKNASDLLRHPRNVWRSDPPWAPPHARPLRSQEGLGGLAGSAVDPEARGPVRDLSTKTSSLRLMDRNLAKQLVA